MPPEATWSYPTEIRFGAGRIAELADVCRDRGMRRPLVVTDRGLASSRMFSDVLSVLHGADIDHAVWTEVRANPVGANVDAGVVTYREGAHDGVVAVGGGSAIDVAKVVALMVGQNRPVWDFEDVGDNWKRAAPHSIAPIIAVPTTAGTGSEVGRAGVVIDERTQRKVIVFHPEMLPVAVICDPELTIALPPALTVGTGMDALSHSLEALCSPNYHPMSHGIATEGCRLVLDNLPRVARDPGDITSRGHMMTAAAMGAVAFQKGLGAMHALSHPIGALFDTHHGTTNATLMPYVLAANRPTIDDDLGRLASYVGIDGGADGVIEHIIGLRDSLGVPHTLIELGVPASAMTTVAQAAVTDPSAAGNPVPLTEALASAMFEAACAGNVS